MKTIEISMLPLDTLEASLRTDPTIGAERDATKERVEEVLEGDFREAAIRMKTSAIWQVMSEENVQAILKEEKRAVKMLEKKYGGRSISALDIIEFLNPIANRIHNELVMKGLTYNNLICEPEVKAALYEMAIPLADMTKMMSRLAEEMRAGKYKSNDKSPKKMANAVLKKLGAMYCARHIVKSCERASAEADAN